MAEIPVYFFTGFMDSGKTTLIQETLFENGFAEDDDRILIIACEDGDVEYDTEKLKTINASVATIDTEAELIQSIYRKLQTSTAQMPFSLNTMELGA